MMACKVCGNRDGNRSHTAREMMFGYGDEFEYVECGECGCLQIKDIPTNLSKYYPKDYYSFKKRVGRKGGLSAFLSHNRTRNYLGDKSLIGMLASRIHKTPDFLTPYKKAGLDVTSDILDVGSGSGRLLLKLEAKGFLKLTGIDPNIEQDISCGRGVKIYKKELSEVNKQFDFIMLNHSFEHMPEPLTVFKELFRVLKADKYALIRIPVASSFAWREYGISWVQLDAPRHLFLHTVKSIRILAKKTGFLVDDVVFDSTEVQFWGSELYLKGIPLAEGKKINYFSKEDIKSFKAKACELNKNEDGDSAGFYLYKPSEADR